MNYTIECLKQYRNLPLDVREAVGNIDALNNIRALERKYNVELKFIVILVMIKELAINDISVYLVKKHKIEHETAEKIEQIMRTNIFSPVIEYLEPKQLEYQTQLDIGEEKKVITEAFESGFFDLLQESDKTLSAINSRTMYFMSQDNNFKLNLEKALYKNEENLTNGKFVLENSHQAPSVKNWLQDFIKQYGTSFFNNITMSRYIADSPNARNLSEEEKKRVKQLLQVYRNIKFFPESQGEAPVEEWQIIPIKRLESLTKARQVEGPPKTKKEVEIEELKQVEEKMEEGSLERKAMDEEIARQKQVEELTFMANKYKEGSLERKAIEEEIRRLE
jgi:hypothetical protein